MALTPADVENLIAELQKDPQLRDRVRNAILAEDFLRLPATVERLADRMDQLAVRMDQLTERMDQLALRMEQLTERLDEFAAETQTNLHRLDGRLGNVEGDLLEAKYKLNVASHVARWFENVVPVVAGNLPELTAAYRAGKLSQDEWDQVIALDVLARGTPVDGDGTETYIAIEISKVVDETDVARADERAGLLLRAGLRATAAVGGQVITKGALDYAKARGVVALVTRTTAA